MSQNTQNPVSNQDVLSAVQTIDQKFTGLFGSLDRKLTEHIEESRQTHEDILFAVNTSFTAMTLEMATKEDLKQELVKVVTKEYLDDKLTALKGDLVSLVRKEDHKVGALINELADTKVLSEPATQRILKLEPFPKG